MKLTDEIFSPQQNEEYFILRGKEVITVGFTQWADWFEHADRVVKHTKFNNGYCYRCSTWKEALSGHAAAISWVKIKYGQELKVIKEISND